MKIQITLDLSQEDVEELLRNKKLDVEVQPPKQSENIPEWMVSIPVEARPTPIQGLLVNDEQVKYFWHVCQLKKLSREKINQMCRSHGIFNFSRQATQHIYSAMLKEVLFER